LSPDAVVADKAYDTNALLQAIAAMNAKAVIPPRANRREQRHWDAHQYKHRNLIERFFCRLKQFRRVATRYDKLMRRFESFVHLSAAFWWLA
jgi:transposase